MGPRVAGARIGVDAEVGLAQQVADGVIRLVERRTAIDLRVRQAVGARLSNYSGGGTAVGCQGPRSRTGPVRAHTMVVA